MELKFEEVFCTCLKPAVQEVQNGEQTLELRLPEALPDIGSVLSAWGQPILRSKEWLSDQLVFSGGMMVWVLYLPEDGSSPRCLEGWIPFQMRWELPEDTPKGKLRIQLVNRFVDARSTSPRKIMVRSGLAALAEGWTEHSSGYTFPKQTDEHLQLKKERYPLMLRREVGEKEFQLSEELKLPGSAPQPAKIISYTLHPQITDTKVIANKVVFRGKGNLHLVYLSQDGQLYSWEFPLSFSQYGELEQSRGSDAQAALQLGVSNLELELGEGEQFHLKCTLLGQFVVEEPEMLEVVTDAYSTQSLLELTGGKLELPVKLDSSREMLSGEQKVPGGASIVVDAQLLVDYPLQRREEQGVRMLYPCSCQVLYYDDEGILHTASSRWEAEHFLRVHESVKLEPAAEQPAEPQIQLGTDQMLLRWEAPAQLISTAMSSIPTVEKLVEGAAYETQEDGPSLILRRAGRQGLWEIAKATRSTVEAIRRANALQSDPEPGQFLLIPVG